MNFKALHEGTTLLLIANVWDVKSAQIAENLGFPALGTSSAAIADMLGYADGQIMAFEELLYIVKRIKANTRLPLSVDLENGYGETTEEVVNHILELEASGVVGINLEDSKVTGNRRYLIEASEFTEQIMRITQSLKQQGSELFLNIRTDTFLLGLEYKLAETRARIRMYEAAGADGIFVPCITQEADIQAVVKSTQLPVNVMCMPDLPDFEKLSALGVKRISMGNFMFGYLSGQLEETLKAIQTSQSFKPLF